MEYKIIISVIATTLVLVGYLPYIRDIFKRKTVPHMFTWFIWALASGIACALQFAGGAGVGAWATLAVSIIAVFIFILSVWIGDKDITRLDVLFLLLSMISLVLWLIMSQPVLSVILIVTTDILGFAPTIRKSWNRPHSETLFTYEITTFRHALTIFALQQFNILTLMYPIAWTTANAIFCILLMIRRGHVKAEVQ